MGTTSNYSWPYPESTDPVADGAIDIQALADAADTTGRAIELATVQRFADATARNTALSGIEVEGMFAFLQDTDVLTYWDGAAWQEFSTGFGYGTATGGSSSTITVGGESWTLLTFTSSGTLTVTDAGLFDFIIVGGGGGGGVWATFGGGGGGAGGYITGTTYLDTNATITIGAGGASKTSGNGTRLNDLVGSLGGAGASADSNLGFRGEPGASSGGSGEERTSLDGDGFSGNDGGDGGTDSAGGGGGAGANGSNGSGGAGGAGGAGRDSSAFRGEAATTTYYGGGGGGAGQSSAGSGGVGGGGAGGTTTGTAGTANTGGGGGGAYTTGGAGGSGIVLVRFKN